MADYEKIIARRPEVADFIRARRSIRYRGEVLAYGANFRCDAFSTDAAGFRHSTLRDKTYSVADCISARRYGLVLGASNSFGFGLAGNENCMASLLAERFGFPFGNVTLPGANSRNLHAQLLAIVARSKSPPAAVVFSSGGDLATFCESSLADPVFGSPNRGQLKSAAKEGSPKPNAARNLPNMLAFTSLWISAVAMLCRRSKVALVLVHQTTFFEKTKPSQYERECALGEPSSPRQERQFANHRAFDESFHERRKAVCDRLGIPLAGQGLTDRLGFIDEFHCDRDGTRLLSEVVGDAVEPLLES
jgi:hypothetical protein